MRTSPNPPHDGRILAGPDPALQIAEGRAEGSFQARAVEGSGYVTREGEAWARRAVPKVRGKAARKAAKRAKHAHMTRDHGSTFGAKAAQRIEQQDGNPQRRG